MKSVIIIALAVVAAVVAAPPDVQIVRSDLDQQPNGEYKLYVETSDGTVREESGQLVEVFDEDKKPHKVITVIGRYAYVNDQGKQELINYQANEEGFKAQGDSIPVAPSARR